MTKYAVISDIHGNLDALEAVLADINEQNVDEIVCLGDIVGYGPDSYECLKRIYNLQREGIVSTVILGNHEDYVRLILETPEFLKDLHKTVSKGAAEGIDLTIRQILGDDRPIGYTIDRIKKEGKTEYVITGNKEGEQQKTIDKINEFKSKVKDLNIDGNLSDFEVEELEEVQDVAKYQTAKKLLDWLVELPTEDVIDTGEYCIGVYHDNPIEPGSGAYVADLNEHPTLLGKAYAPEQVFDKWDDNIKIKITGHTHHKLYDQDNNRELLNPGSVGLPRDGESKARYLTIDTQANKINFKSVYVDFASVADRAVSLGLPDKFTETKSGSD